MGVWAAGVSGWLGGSGGFDGVEGGNGCCVVGGGERMPVSSMRRRNFPLYFRAASQL